jgi:hypothetical protein
MFWLFGKRFSFETRKYTSGIILNAGVTALVIAMLVVASSFLSASYRANGQQGPRIFSIMATASTLDLSLDMPRTVNVTCGISDYYPVEKVLLYYSTDFWKSRVSVAGTVLSSNLTGTYYQFTIPLLQVPETYLYFLWANNSVGYFSYADNQHYYYSILVQNENASVPFNAQDPKLLHVIQSMQIGYGNGTTTRNPAPFIYVELNETSPISLVLNGNPSDSWAFTGNRIYNLTLPMDLTVGTNLITLNVDQKRIFSFNFTVIYSPVPLNITSMNFANNSVVYNYMTNMTFSANDLVQAHVTTTGPQVGTWNSTTYATSFTVPWTFGQVYGNYTIGVSINDHYGGSFTETYSVSFQKSEFPWIHVDSPANGSTVVASNITITANFTEACAAVASNLNTTTSTPIIQNVTNVTLPALALMNGWNYIQVNATNLANKTTSVLLRVNQVLYSTNNGSRDLYVVPGGTFHLVVNVTSLVVPNGTLRYALVNSSGLTCYSVSLNITGGELGYYTMKASIPIPLATIDMFYNYTLQFNTTAIIFNEDGQSFHVLVSYLYQDTEGPTVSEEGFSPGVNSITSSNYVTIILDLNDLTGVKNASIEYATNPSLATPTKANMTFTGEPVSNGIGDWVVTLPPYPNSTTVYFKVLMYDVLNNSASFTGSYSVHDVLNPNTDQIIPGVINQTFNKAINGAIGTLIAIMVMILSIFIVIFITINDQNVKREIFRESDRLFTLKHVCELSEKSIRHFYYIEQGLQDLIGYGIGIVMGFVVLAPVFVWIIKITLISWTYNFQTLFFLSYSALGSWVGLLLVLFVLSGLLIKMLQVDRHVAKMGH